MSLRAQWQQWFFRRTAAEPSPIVLDRRRVYILPTRTGLLFALVLVAMYVGAINYNLGLGHALVFLLVGIGCVDMLHTYRNLAGIEISPGRCAPVFAGDAIVHHFLFRTRDPRERVALVLKRGDATTAVNTVVPGAAGTDATLAFPAAVRGVHPLGRLRISTSYPLGLYEAWSYPFPDSVALVYPRPTFRPLPAPVAGAENGSLNGDVGDEDFSGFRIRQPADSPRHVAWKAFARDPDHQPLQVKTFAGGALPELWVDWNLLAAEPDAEARLSVLCGWVLQASRDGLRYGLRLPGKTVAMDHGEAHRDRCLAALAQFERSKGPA